MRIKKLELIGFKSFKDRTVIHFDAGITGVVGPNGCGKSNIVDALVWVMGEMSAKHLRGASMEDVIFAGAEGYSPMGMAEVTLTLENDGGPFPVKYLNHSEIMITRRLHRSGDSEYLINKEGARLRDIHEIFMDTGAGSKGFSIIEQGAIGKIVTAKPEDRRMLIEEAAGITKFKARKKESLRKLKATDANLIRLQDIIGELKRQLESLQRQAQRAERYRNLKKQLEDIELWLSSREFLEIRERINKAQGDFNEAQAKEVEASADLSQVEAELMELRTIGVEKEKSIEEFRVGLGQSQAGVRERENQIQELKFEIEQAKRSKDMAGSIFAENKVREQTLLDDFNRTQERLAEVSGIERELREAYQLQHRVLAEKNSRIQIWDDEFSEKRRQLLTASGAEAETRSKVAVLTESLADGEAKYLESKELLAEINMQKEVYTKNQKRVFLACEAERQMQLAIMGDVESFRANRDTLAGEVQEKDAQIKEYQDKLNAVSSRLTALEGLRNNYEGFQVGVKSVMSWQQSLLAALSSSERENQVHFQPMADIVNVQQEFEVAFEAALGPKMQMLLSSDNDEAMKAIAYLKQQKAGRSTFYSATGTVQTHDGSETAMLEQAKGFQCWLKDQVTVAEPYRDRVHGLIDKVVVVEQLSVGVELSKNFPSWSFVTRDGDLVDQAGIIAGGCAEDAHSGVLQRQREIKELELATEEWSGKLALAVASHKKLTAQLKRITEELEKAQKDKTEKEILVAGLQKDLERADAELANANRAVEKQEKDLAHQEKIVSEKRENLDRLNIHLQDLAERKSELESRIEELTTSLENEKFGLGDLQSQVTSLQVNAAKKEQEKLGVEAEHKRLEVALTEVRQQMEKMDAESSKNVQLMSDSQVQLERKKVELELLLQKVEDQEQRLAAMREEFEKTQSRSFALQASVSEQMAERGQLQKIINESQLVLEQSIMKRDNLLALIHEKYMCNLAEIAEQYRDRQGDLVEARKEITELKEKLGRIGEVNLSAIAEYDGLVQRYEFLRKQFDDLTDAKDQLGKVIERINRICAKRFKETFEAVNERFTRVFPVLFGGGEAKLILVEDAEAGEMGIDIVSRPPGKKMQSVSLLSGGEKALTAVSLIFSIFLVKPSPYCLLDEVDAPLDDANVMRFNDLVREMAKRSQIIVVTHNKYTMEIAEKLYGVTMEEKGVSKMVSVDLAGNTPLVDLPEALSAH